MLYCCSIAQFNQASLSIGFSRQEYWNGLPPPSPGDLPDLRIELASLAFMADSLPLILQGSTSFIVQLFGHVGKLVRMTKSPHRATLAQ